MSIRKYILVMTILMLILITIGVIGYQSYYSKDSKMGMEKFGDNFRFVKTDMDNIQIYVNDNWENMTVKGVEISAFTPGHSRYKTKIDKKLVMDWLEDISELNGNTIKITGIQSPAFYNAIYDYNREAENPIYTIHEIKLDDNKILKHFDVYDSGVLRKFKRDIKRTIDIIHGKAFLLRGKRNYSGLYLKDISEYNLGYILGANTNLELITLTDLRHKEKNQYRGENIYLEEGSPFEAFVAKMLDFAMEYEIDKYDQVSLFSYLTDIETDPMEYKYQPKIVKDAKINMDKMDSGELNNLFVAYRFHPSSVEFLDYEDELEDEYETGFQRQLGRLKSFYKKPVIISDTGISSSRAISKRDLIDGYNRGGFSEKQQGEKIVQLLKSIDNIGLAGGIINSWQDDWTSITSSINVRDYSDKNTSNFWYNAQSSNEAFGLIGFQLYGDNNVYLDGDLEDWKGIKPLIDGEMKLKVRAEPSYLYLLVEKPDLHFDREDIFIGIQITEKSGSDYWESEGVRFNIPVNFIVRLNGYNESRILVHERYNIFDYLYKYYSPIIDKQDTAPDKYGNVFNPLYILNRRKFYFPEKDEIIQPVYYETGKLTHGNDNPKSSNFNSLADFHVSGDIVELKIPWDIINVKNPIDMFAYEDFYSQGLEKDLKINSISFSIYDKEKEKTLDENGIYKMGRRKKNRKYDYRLKESYFILKDYWSD